MNSDVDVGAAGADSEPGVAARALIIIVVEVEGAKAE